MPDWKTGIRQRLAGLSLAPTRENAIVEELSQHLDELYEALLASGATPNEAMRQTRAELRGSSLLTHELRRIEQQTHPEPIVLGTNRRSNMIADLWQDVRFGARMLRKQPGFTLVAVLTLAMGIGATTAIFSVVNAVLLRPLPFPNGERIVRLWETLPAEPGLRYQVRFLNFQDWRQNQVFSHLAAYREDGFNLQTGAETQRLEGTHVTTDFFHVLGVQPAQGRAFSAQEDAPGGERVVIISHALWQQSFGGSTQLIGQQLKVDGQNHTVVGIMPPGFSFPGYGYANEETHLWLPYALATPATGRGQHRLRVLGRLQPNVTVAQARAEFDTIAQRLEQAYPATNKGAGVFMIPLHTLYSEDLQRPLTVLLCAVLFVLLIACANVANLMLARQATRAKEIAIRAVLGAGRARIVRQLLTESLLLMLIGGVGGLLLAAWGVALLTRFGPSDIPRLQEATLDVPVLFFTLVVSVLTGLIFGLVPAWRWVGLDPNAALNAGAVRTMGGAADRLRKGLVIAEIALAMMLLVGAGLLLKSFVRLQQVAPGFEAQGGLTMDINLPANKYLQPEQRAAHLEQVLMRLRTLPGVEFAGATHRLPLRGNSGTSFEIEGRSVVEGQPRPRAIYRAIAPEYFRAMGTPLLAGRTFTEEEAWRKPTAVIINQTLARHYWPQESPLGKRLKNNAPNSDWAEIVGVVADTKENELAAEVREALYLPYVASADPAMTLVLRTGIEPLRLVAAAREELRRVDAEQAVSSISTLSQLLDEATAQPRFNATLLAVFALLALMLATVGIYGVIAYAVAQRTREIGIRIALGASKGAVLWLVLNRSMAAALIGVGLGLLGSFGLTRLLEGMLFDVKAMDPLVLGLVSVLLMGVAFVACYFPARRATKIDPLIAIRWE